jgi:hypothetical protein
MVLRIDQAAIRALLLGFGLLAAVASGGNAQAQGPQTNPSAAVKALQDKRFPQPVRVGAMTGWPVIQTGGRYRRLGVVVGVFQPQDDDPQLVFRYRKGFGQPERLIAPPLDQVALVGAMVKIADLDLDELDKLPTFQPVNGRFLGANDIVRIGVDKKY